MTTEFGSAIVITPGEPMPVPEARVTAPETDTYMGGSAQRGALLHAWYSLGFGGSPDDRITCDSAMTYSAVWGCVRVIAQSLAGPGWHVYDRSPDGRSKATIDDEVAWTLGAQANPEMSAFDWRQVMLKDALIEGNGYAEIERLNNGRLAALWRLAPNRVKPVRDEAGSLWYQVDNGTGREPSYLHPSEVFHLRGLGPDGVVGWSVIEMAKRSIQLGLQEERYGSQVFSSGPMPGGVLTIQKQLNVEQRKQYQKDFQDRYSGANNARKVIVLSGGDTFTPASLPNDDAQFLESRRFQVGEICRWYGVPPHKLADLERATFSNIEEQEIDFVRATLLPWARRLESEADIKLCGQSQQRHRRYTRINLDALMRGNSTTQTDTVARKVAGGLMTPNEGREYLDLNPAADGDKLLVQGAMTTLERVEAGEPPAGPAPVRPDPQQVRQAFAPLLADAFGRLLRVDADKARRAANKGKLAEHVAEWYADPDAMLRVGSMLLPLVDALLMAAGLPIAERSGVKTREAAARHVERCRADLAGGTACLTSWESGPSASMIDQEISHLLA